MLYLFRAVQKEESYSPRKARIIAELHFSKLLCVNVLTFMTACYSLSVCSLETVNVETVVQSTPERAALTC